MKNAYKIAILTSVFIAMVPVHMVMAANATSSADSVVIDQLKQRLATKVAELRTVVKRAMSGTVKTVSVASATVETSTKDIKIELGDTVSVAQIIGGKRTTLTTDQISAGDPITVFGTYDETLDLLKAQFIFIESSVTTQHVSGTVTDIDQKNFTATIETPEGRSIIVDIEKVTKTSSWSATDGIVKSGFSKVSLGDTLHVAGTAEPKKDGRMSALRILDLGNLSGVKPTTTPTSTPEASDSATPKSTSKSAKSAPSPTP